jgi:replicative DNA helicase
MSSITVPANATHYASIVREKATLRRLAEASLRSAQLAYTGQGDADMLVSQAQQIMWEVSDRDAGDDCHPVADLIGPTWDEMEALSAHGGRLAGVPTGFHDLDRLTNGLHPGQMVIVAARPAVGKSTLALDFARSAAVHNKLATVLFSLEMSASEIMMRLLSAEASVPLRSIREGRLDGWWEQLNDASGRVANSPLLIDDSPHLTMTDIRAKGRRLKQRDGLALAVIDYIQLMSSGRKVESRQLEVSEFSRQIKLMAKELDIPVVAVSQLNRDVEQGDKARVPRLSNLRESGSLEQDADMVVLLNRPESYDRDTDRRGEADLIVAKHRNGPTGTVTVRFQGHLARFTDPPADVRTP